MSDASPPASLTVMLGSGWTIATGPGGMAASLCGAEGNLRINKHPQRSDAM